MITEILFLSVEQAGRLAPCRDTAVVSILDFSEEHQRPAFDGFKDVLRLSFEDTYEEVKLAREGHWPDEPTDEEHALFCQGKGERIPTLTDAKQIVAFLEKHAFSLEQTKLVVHCFMGVSRSAAVAHWASVRFWVPLDMTHKSTDFANKRVMRLLDKAAGRI